LQDNFFWIGSVRIRRERILIKFGGFLQRPVYVQPCIASIPDDFHEPRTRIAAAEAGEESESAQVCFLGYVVGILLISH